MSMLFDLERVPEPLVFNRHHGNAPAGAIYIGRGTPFGNPFSLQDIDPATGRHYTRAAAIERYEAYVLENPELLARIKRELRGKDLLCSCKPAACHGDVLLRLANS